MTRQFNEMTKEKEERMKNNLLYRIVMSFD